MINIYLVKDIRERDTVMEFLFLAYKNYSMRNLKSLLFWLIFLKKMKFSIKCFQKSWISIRGEFENYKGIATSAFRKNIIIQTSHTFSLCRQRKGMKRKLPCGKNISINFVFKAKIHKLWLCPQTYEFFMLCSLH